jgi:PHP family Zn ribbon phosphoesterase
MPFIADLHLHSKYSRATSRDMGVESLAQWARKKRIGLLGTGDFTHPTYFAELQAKLTPAEPGLYRLKKGEQGVRFMVQVEVSNIYRYRERERVRKIHTLVYAPSLEAAGGSMPPSLAGSQFAILVQLRQEDLGSFVPPRVLKAILRVQGELVTISPGYDGVYGTIKVFGDELVETSPSLQPSQIDLF